MTPLPKLHRFYEENECYHLTAAVRDRAAVFSNADHARIVVDTIQFVRRERAHILAYVVMPDHLHVVATPKRGYNISSIMQSVKGYSARVINQRSGSRGALWQRSFYDRIIRDESELFDTIEYVHMNPVVAGLVDDPDACPFSSAGREDKVDLQWLA